jgi:hypothetical protein
MIQKKWKSIALYIGLACAILLNLVIALRPVFSYDESYTIAMARNSFSDIVRITANDVHAPLYYFMVKIIGILMGGSIYAGRVLSLLCVALFVLLGWKTCKKTEAKAWLLLFAFTQPLVVAQTTESRMYAMALLFFTLAGVLAQQIYMGKVTLGVWIAFTMTSIIAVYSHTYTMLMMVMMYLFLLGFLFSQRRAKEMIAILGSGVVVGLAYLPWLFVLVEQFQNKVNSNEMISRIDRSFAANEAIATASYEWFSDFYDPNSGVWYLGILATAVLAFYVFTMIRETKRYELSFGYIAIGLTVMLGLYLEYKNPTSGMFLGRYVFPAFGLVMITWALGMDKCCKSKVMKVALCMVMIYCGLWAYRGEYQLSDQTGYQAYEKFLEQNYKEGDVIMANTRYQMLMSIYHPGLRYMVYGAVDEYSPYQNTEAFTSWDQLEGVNTVWVLHFSDIYTADLGAEFYAERALEYHYGYYDFIIEKWKRRQ